MPNKTKKQTKKSKTQLVAEHLASGRTLTQLECTTLYRSTRLSDIILRLRKRGWDIETLPEEHSDGIHGRYVLRGIK